MKKAISIIAFVLPLLVIATILSFVNPTWLSGTAYLHGHEVSAEMTNGIAVVLMLVPALLVVSFLSSMVATKLFVAKFERAL